MQNLLAMSRDELVEDRTILAFADRVARERDALSRLPGVAAAHAASVAAYAALARRLVLDIPNHRDEIDPALRDEYFALVDACIARGVTGPG